MIDCRALWRRIIPPTGGAWIPYTAAQVAARRAAQMVLVTTCTLIPTPAATPGRPVPWAWEPVLLVPRLWGDPGAAVATPEPGTWALMLAALAMLWVAR